MDKIFPKWKTDGKQKKLSHVDGQVYFTHIALPM